MIPGLPNPYVLLAAAGIWLASIVGAYFYGTNHEATKWEAAVAKQERDATQLLADLTATALAKDAAASEFARNLDKVLNDANEKIADAATAAERDFDARLRRIAASRPRCPAAGTVETPNPSRTADSPAGSEDRLLEGIGKRLRRVGEGANKLAALVRDVCIPFANEVGR